MSTKLGESERERLALLMLGLNAALDLASEEDAELVEALDQCRELVSSRLANSPTTKLEPESSSRAGLPVGIQTVRTAMVIQSGLGSKLADKRQSPTKTSPNSEPVERAPKLQTVFDILNEFGISTEDICAFVDLTDAHDVTSANYVLLRIVRLDLEIAVCDELGHSTYVASGLPGPEFWNNRTKQELLDTVAVTSIVYRSVEQFRKRLTAVISDTANSPVTEHVDDIVERPSEFECNKVIECIEAHYNAAGEMPTQESGIIRFGPYANGKTTWKAISMAFHKKQALQADQVSDISSPTLIELTRIVAETNGIYDPYAFRGVPISEDGIRQTIKEHFETTGTWPTITPDVVKVGPYKNKIAWKTIDDALRKGHRGLAGGSSLPVIRRDVQMRQKTAK